MRRMAVSFPVLFLLILPLLSISTRASQDRFFMQIGVEDVDQDLAILTTRYFHTYVNLYEREPARIHLFFRDPYRRGDFFCGDFEFKKDLMGQIWGTSLLTLPEQGARPWKWPLMVIGEFPNDRYVLNFLVALNVTVDFGDVTISVELSDALRKKWITTHEFARVKATPDQFAALQVDYERFEYVLGKCTDFYGLEVVFGRPDSQIQSLNVYWYIAAALAVAIAAMIVVLSQRVSSKEIIAVCIPVAAFAAERLSSLQQYLPRSKGHWIERIYIVEVLGTIVWAVVMILLRKRDQSKENASQSADLGTKILSPAPMCFGTELEYRLAKQELRWLKRERGRLEDTDLTSIANKYRFPIDFLKETMQKELAADDYMISKSKWFPVLYAWAIQRKITRKGLMKAYIAYGRTVFQLSLTTAVLVLILGYLPLLYALKILEPVQLVLAVIFPYVLFMIPFMYPLWKEMREKGKELQDLIDQTRRSGYGYLADATHRFLMKNALALMLTRFKRLERDVPEIVAYQIGKMPDGTPIAIAENPEQAYMGRLRSLADRPS